MNFKTNNVLQGISYKRSLCSAGIIHLGVGAFHRAHQAVYMDDILKMTDQTGWGIVGVNLRPQESGLISQLAKQDHRYTLTTMSSLGEVNYREVGSILESYDWSVDQERAAEIASRDNIHMITMTVTESGYYLLDDGCLDMDAKAVLEGIEGKGSCVYTYLRKALNIRRKTSGKPITLLSCDNLRDNGHKLKIGFEQFLKVCSDSDLLAWVKDFVTFPCCMVDRITPRINSKHAVNIKARFDVDDALALMSESFIQWVIEDNFAGSVPPFEQVGVKVVENVAPYEDAKIRMLNGCHTILTYLAALKGYETYDAGLSDPELANLFSEYQTNEVIPAIKDSPIDLYAYGNVIKERFSNANIADSTARICADGASKFPIFILVTLQGAYAQGIKPRCGLQGIASWYVFMCHVDKGKIPFDYFEPKWDLIKPLLQPGHQRDFAENKILWGTLPKNYPEFVEQLVDAISDMQARFPC